MVTYIVVIVFNVTLSIACLYGAWRIWQLRRAIARAANAIARTEGNTHSALQNAPRPIYQGQIGIRGVRQRYQQLEIQWQKIQQILATVALIYRIGRKPLQRSSYPGKRGVGSRE
ncbi:MAG TPA: hypothetical protein DEG17_05980 [Cyanobacteria bacterium UBA11149]|nr:hypothetical protein [Cyanobacteria bacterium UBA11149]